MSKTDIVIVYEFKGNSDTLAAVISKEVLNFLKLKKGNKPKAGMTLRRGYKLQKYIILPGTHEELEYELPYQYPS